ncbi:hypothetical protein HNY73_000177 [Argiope bruennichi]|uniref:Uncharacterized protein n=1 Tax=Argiope bruennichi TaxID=94029 RepID=A0A8T0G158_ARGBR|nr:hypothetical protein HNY73_000177 [Argiope bruennichi]
MVMKNAISGREMTDLPALYDELDSKIRTLESLGRTQEKYVDFLSPLVESCLPEEILIAWERHRNLNEVSDGTRSLEQLLNFLNKEVKGEQLIGLSRSGFASGSQRKRHMCPKSVPDYGTASMLVNTFDKNVPGAGVIGRLFINESVQIDSGLSIINTRLGNVITGSKKLCKGCNVNYDMTLSVLSLYVKNAAISELGDLETIGMNDPVAKINKSKEQLKVLEYFQNNMKILSDDRNEVSLPFRENASELLSNKELTLKRHKRMCERIKQMGLLHDYQAGHRVDTGKDGHVRTIRVKTQHTTLVRPIQRIFPLEVSGRDFQKQLGPSADSSVETFVKYVNLPQVSRFGREIKRPNRLNFSDS